MDGWLVDWLSVSVVVRSLGFACADAIADGDGEGDDDDDDDAAGGRMQ